MSTGIQASRQFELLVTPFMVHLPAFHHLVVRSWFKGFAPAGFCWHVTFFCWQSKMPVDKALRHGTSRAVNREPFKTEAHA